MAYALDPALREYATDRQWGVLEALAKHGTQRKAAAALGVAASLVWAAKRAVEKKAAQHGYAPDHDLRNPVPTGFHVSGYSILRDAQTGDAKLIWEKTRADAVDHEAALRAAAEELAQDVKRVEPRKTRIIAETDNLLPIIPMGDPHFGMYAWADETGEDFDLDIAKRDLCAAVAYLIEQSPPSKRLVIANLGDFFHVDNLKNMTAQSGNVLDVDTRLPKMVSVGVSALRYAIERGLDRHETVEVINAIGNHDGVLALALSIMLANVYEKEPRVIINDKPTPRHYIEHGRVMIGVTHGDRTKDRDLPGIMATEQSEAWGRTRHRYFYRGHHHHDTVEMFNGCTVEQFSTLAPNDAWHNAGGYLTGRNMKMIVHHSEYGEVARSVCSIDMLRGVKCGS